MKRSNIQQAMSTARHPQTDGQTERANRSIKEMLRSFVNARQDNWDEYLAQLEFAYNNSRQTSTGHTPFYLNHGYHPASNFQLLPAAQSEAPAALDFIKNINTALQEAQQSISKSQQRQARNADVHRRDLSFKVGDQVLLNTSNLRTVSGLQPRWIGPFTITNILNPVAVKLDLPATFKLHKSFHVSQLRQFKTSQLYHDRQNHRPPPLQVSSSTEHEYEVERIIGHRRIQKGRTATTQYLIKWLGYPMYECTWEPLKHLKNSARFLKQYQQMQTEADS